MRTAFAFVILLAVACGGPKKQGPSSIVPEGSDSTENCCCKSTPATSEEGKPLYQMTGRMECSSQHGECEPDVQCQPTKN